MKQVIVKNKEETYSTYKNWIVRYFPEELKNFKYGKVPLENKIYNVLGKESHEFEEQCVLYLIQDIDTKQVYIIGEKGIKFVKENKMKDKLKVKVWNYKNVVLFEVLEQDEELRDESLRFKASNDWSISSYEFPEISLGFKEIFIRGTDKTMDKYIDTGRTETTQEAKQLVKEVKQAVKEFNESFNQILDKEEKEYLSAAIKPFRDRVKYITRYNAFTHEYISIELDNEDFPFPGFEKNTMYKGMEVDKHYTLEELGL